MHAWMHICLNGAATACLGVHLLSPELYDSHQLISSRELAVPDTATLEQHTSKLGIQGLVCRCCYAAATPGGCLSPLPAYGVQRLLWLPRVVLVCAYVGATTSSHGPKPANLPCQLLLYPRYHLDHSSLLARYPLPQVSPLLSTTLHPP